ncbi:MAG TPA: hypothetical protein EYO33_18810 [Phycisphaerales bacterium]|nr:hypothetical protein [Phycisphaerales bacterium]
MSPDPKAYHIALELSDLPAGSELFSESEFSLQAGSQKDYPALNREYIIPTSKGKVLIVAVYAILDTKENAAVAFSRYPVHIREHRDDNLVGDRTFGDYPRLTVLLQDRADVGIQLLPMKGYEVQDLKQEQLDAVLSPPLANLLLQNVVQKLDQQGYLRSEKLEIELTVDSSRASPSSSVLARAVVTDSSVYPVTFSWSISNANEVLFSSENISAPNGSTSITWDGKDSEGNFYPSGPYQLNIGVRDVLGRSESTAIDCLVEGSGSEDFTLASAYDSTLQHRNPTKAKAPPHTSGVTWLSPVDAVPGLDRASSE